MKGTDSGMLLAMRAEQRTHFSSLIEKNLEYRFLADIGAELLLRGMPFEILRGDVDRDGYDIVIEDSGTMRHIQLKAMAAGGRRAEVTVHKALMGKPSGCVVWTTYDPQTFRFTGFRWFGADAGRPLPSPGSRTARHSKANAAGVKLLRPLHSVIRASAFVPVGTIAELADRLFSQGSVQLGPADLLVHVRSQPAPAGPDWICRLHAGKSFHIPTSLDWQASVELAHLVDGYLLLRQTGGGVPEDFLEKQYATASATGAWPGSIAALWISLFLEHRRWRFSPAGPVGVEVILLDRLVAQLRDAIELTFKPGEHQ